MKTKIKNKINFEKLSYYNLKFVLYTTPIAIITVVLSIYIYKTFGDKNADGVIFDILGIHFILWFLSLILLVSSLTLLKNFREKILCKLIKSEERDERETYIAGKASKSTLLASIAFLVLLFILSITTIRIEAPTDAARNAGKKGYVSIGFSTSLIKNSMIQKIVQKNEPDSKDYKFIIHYNGVPLSQSALILLIMIFYISVYHFYKWQYQKKG